MILLLVSSVDLASSDGVELAVMVIIGLGMASARPFVTSITEITDSCRRAIR